MTYIKEIGANISDIIAIAEKAGEAIMEIYSRDSFGTTYKDDNSPLTRADTASHHIIKESLKTFYEGFTEKWKSEIPSAVSSLSQSIDCCLTFFDFPQEEWISLRTTNIIERLNKEFKRRTKPMEILAGEAACYRLLAFISLKMELSWRTNRVGKVRPHLPLYAIYTK